MIKNISKILFPTDFSDSSINAFKYAVFIANTYGATIELYHFYNPEFTQADIPVISGEMTSKKEAIARQLLDAFIHTVYNKDDPDTQHQDMPEMSTHVKMGSPKRLIFKEAKKHDIDIIIMGTQGEHNILNRIFGSVTTATIQRATCPVLAIPDNVITHKISTIAYASDLQESDPFHIWEMTKLFSIFSPSYKVIHINGDESDKTLDLNDLQQFFQERASSLNISFHTLSGDDTIEVIENFNHKNGVDLLVLHHPDRNFFERLFHSSLTRQLALHFDIPMLIL